MDGDRLVDFLLSKGCGLEFKRTFQHITENLDDVALKRTVTWPNAPKLDS